jgi:hypothetical protein
VPEAQPSFIRRLIRGPKPAYRGDLFCEVTREYRRASRLILLALVAPIVLGLALVRISSTADWQIVGFGLAIVGPICLPALVTPLLVRPRIRPSCELLMLRVDAAIREWEAIDGSDGLFPFDEGLRRLAGKTTDLEVANRLSILVSAGELEKARIEFANWQPSDQRFKARRERIASVIEFESRGLDDLSAARAAAEAISDATERRNQLIWLEFEAARRRAIEGGDALGVLVDARRRFGPIRLDRRPQLVRLRKAWWGAIEPDVFEPTAAEVARRMVVRVVIGLLVVLALYGATAELILRSHG